MLKRYYPQIKKTNRFSSLERKEMINFTRSVLILLNVLTLFTVLVPAQKAVESNKPNDETVAIVVAVTGGRVRSEPNTKSAILKESTIGSRYNVVESKNGWSKIQLSEAKDDEEAKMGWISNSITAKFDGSQPGVIYQQITDRYFKKNSLSFDTAKELFDFLPKAADEAKTFEIGGDLRLKRLMAFSMALKAIPNGKEKSSPYKEFLEKHKQDIVYSEPSGEWYVRSEEFWELHQRYQKYNVGEEIAWQAAGNPTPGECEGYINCHLYRLRITHGEYLNFYPNGKHSKEALNDVNNLLQPIISDLPAKSVYYTASDISDRAEFNSMLADLRKIISKSPHLEKTKILKQIQQIAEGHR